jgi:UDP-N-acetylmuramoyl-L-alanyl-D-glutamate--2,6-diaminopimelate ligase
MVTGPEDDFTVLVDYAHTDDALANVLHTLRPLVPIGGRLCVIFGCGGDRDRAKRPRMGRVAAELADELIVTSDNPRTEDPDDIIDEILPGVSAGHSTGHRDVAVLPDRARAIQLAVARSGPGDVVLIAGKGHEPYQVVGTERRAFDDRIVALEALQLRRSKVKVA